MKNNVIDLLEQSAKQYAGKAAFGDEKRDITFKELKKSAMAVGTFLLHKIEIAEPVAFYMDKSVPAVCGMFGTVYAGGFYSFLDVKQPQARTESVLGILKPKVIFTDSENFERISSYATGAEIVLLEELLGGSADVKKLKERRKDVFRWKMFRFCSFLFYIILICSILFSVFQRNCLIQSSFSERSFKNNYGLF